MVTLPLSVIDLFATGIGGLRSAFQAQGGQCVFTSEYDALRAEDL
ncbi:MAG: DNA cytosine methyltransferase, partial [Thermomonas sp.]|nr:DNA cytosine methyltransferase [Thermomonas sp.]